MKNTVVKVLLVMTIISAAFLCVLLYLSANRGNREKQKSRLEEYQQQYEERVKDSKTLYPEVYYDFSKLENNELLYDTARHSEVYDRIQDMKRASDYTEDAPLVIWNPYGVNSLSLYVYFKTAEPMTMSYRISPNSDTIPTFSAVPEGGGDYVTEHEYLLVGLASEQSNRVTLTLQDEKENSRVRTFWVTPSSRFATGSEKLDVRKGTGSGTLSEGFFANLGNVTGEKEAVLLYDNDGVLRSELPILSGSCKRLLFFENRMYYNISDTQVAAVNRFGRVEKVYTLNGFTIGNDYCIDEDQKKLLVLGSKAGEGESAKGVNDRVIAVDLVSGEEKEVLDMSVLLKEYKAICEPNEEGVLEWLNLNSIQLMKEGVLLGSRETSAVFKVTDLYEVPVLEYIIAEPLIFSDTGYENLLLAKDGGFASFFGANTMTYGREALMSSNQYTFYVYDNHISGTDSRPELDYSAMADDLGTSLKKGDKSFFRKYLVNELEGIWQEVEATELDYSGYAGSAQLMENGNLITVTAGRFTYNEYNAERELLRTYVGAGKEYLDRVFKYDFKEFYFEGNDSAGKNAELSGKDR